MGLRYRAGLLGAELTIRREDGQGTVVSCSPFEDQPHGEK